MITLALGFSSKEVPTSMSNSSFVLFNVLRSVAKLNGKYFEFSGVFSKKSNLEGFTLKLLRVELI